MTEQPLNGFSRTEEWLSSIGHIKGRDAYKQEVPPIKVAHPSNQLLIFGPGMVLFDIKRTLLKEPDFDTLIHHITARPDFIPFADDMPYHRDKYVEPQGRDVNHRVRHYQKNTLCEQLSNIATVCNRYDNIRFSKDIPNYKNFWPEFFGEEFFLDTSQVNIPRTVMWFRPEFHAYDEHKRKYYLKEHFLYQTLVNWGIPAIKQQPWSKATAKSSRMPSLSMK